MIPELDADGHLPPGRYQCSLEEVESSFVTASRLATSVTRQDLFGGLIRYLAAWEDTQKVSGADSGLLRTVWLAGSFASGALNPSDVDVSPLIDGVVADSIAGRPGSGKVKKLTKDRDSIKAKYGVEVFPVRWFPVTRPFAADMDLTGDQRAYLSDRGMMDDWWQRCRIAGEDVPSEASCRTRRGYLEVVVDESS